jgi:geranylgeranyl diphosphate synthase type I
MTSSHAGWIIDAMGKELDAALHRFVDRLQAPRNGLWEMASYAMGWTGTGAGPETTGKRIRPLLCLLVCGGCGADWHAALSPACAVELIHSFSLIHDDIQDGSTTRRGRPSVWKQYGMPQAINVGDTIFTLAFSLLAGSGSEHAVEWMHILSATCLRLTYGQFLDLTYEDAEDIGVAEYQDMIGGKTAALAEAACRLGAMSAGAPVAKQEAFAEFGRALGLAFQIQDDYLGVWGDPRETGKPNACDLSARKKSLPILFGLASSERFRALFRGNITPESIPALLAELEECGAEKHSLSLSRQWIDQAVALLKSAQPQGEYALELETLVKSLLDRRK